MEAGITPWPAWSHRPLLTDLMDITQTTCEGDAGSPRRAAASLGMVLVREQLTQSGCSVSACPWHSGFASPLRFLVQCLFIQASRRDEACDPLCRTWREGRDFPKRSVLAALFCR